MKTYIYPKNMRAKAHLWLWGIRDFVILAIAVLLSAVVLVKFGLLLPAALSMAFGVITIRAGDVTILDYMTYAVRYFLIKQKYYEWR